MGNEHHKKNLKELGNTSTMYCDMIPDKKIMYLFNCDDFGLFKKYDKRL
jgi:hypothetical protein